MRIQDEGSQLIGELAAFAAEGSEHRRMSILDVCAAPGGKTLILAERNPQARIVACEANERRLEHMQVRLAQHANHVDCRLADATALNDDAVFDVVLADVPCSGTGTLERNPEIRHRLRPEDLARHAERQRAILRAVIRAARPGGQIVYSTCSLEPEENEQVVASVLVEESAAKQASFASKIDGMRRAGIVTAPGAAALQTSLTPEGALRLLPGVAETDGFYAALIEKNG